MLKHLRREYYKKSTNFRWILCIILAIFASFIFGIIGGILAPNLNQDFFSWVKGSIKETITQERIIEEKVIKSLIEEENATIKAVNNTLASTVNIIVTKEIAQMTGPLILPFEFFFEGQQFELSEPETFKKTEVGGGSGFIISSDGLILTNKHVVSDANAEYSVILSDGRRFDAKVLAADPFMDLAVLKIEAKDLPIVKLGDSEQIALGQTVIAIGFSLSEYQNSVTKGIISGIHRQISADGETIDEAIQTDAAINPGNSGGPLINLKGEVIGINTAINRQGQLIGFAIPINSAKLVIESVQTYGKIIRPWIGVRYILLNKEISEANKLPVDYGALLVKGQAITDFAVIPSSPADKAGLKEGDIILKINDTKIDEKNSLAKMIRNFSIDETIILRVLRQGEEININITLEEYKKE